MSVLVTAYRHAPFVAECLDGVAAQTFTDWELLVADDASDDGTADVLRAWAGSSPRPVTVVVNDRNLGVTATLTGLLARARGDLVAHLGGDDRWHPDLLHRLVAALDAAGPEAALAHADAALVDRDGAVVERSRFAHVGPHLVPHGDGFHRLLERNAVVASAVLYRRAAIEAVGGWDPGLPYEDYDLLLRLADRFRLVAVDEVLADHRLHDGSATRQRFSTLLEARLVILERWLGRDDRADELILPQLRHQSWRLFKVHPDLGRPHVALAYQRGGGRVGGGRGGGGTVGRLRHLVATRPWVEAAFEVLRRVTRPVRSPQISRRR